MILKRDRELCIKVENPSGLDYDNLIKYINIYAKDQIEMIKKYRKNNKHVSICVIINFRRNA